MVARCGDRSNCLPLVPEHNDLSRDEVYVAVVREKTDLPLDPLPARADANRLKRVVENLISNALKYTPEGGRVTVRLSGESAASTMS